MELNYETTKKLISLANKAKQIKSYDIANAIAAIFLRDLEKFINTDDLDTRPYYMYREESYMNPDLSEEEVLNDPYFKENQHYNLIGVMLAKGSLEESHDAKTSLSIPHPQINEQIAELAVRLSFQEASRIEKFFHNRKYSKAIWREIQLLRSKAQYEFELSQELDKHAQAKLKQRKNITVQKLRYIEMQKKQIRTQILKELTEECSAEEILMAGEQVLEPRFYLNEIYPLFKPYCARETEFHETEATSIKRF